MTAFHLSTDSDDRKRWLDLLQTLPPRLQDIHFHPDYLNIYERTYPDQIAHLFGWQTSGCTLFKPFMSKAIPGTDLLDLSSVYGYGGPLAIGAPKQQDLLDFDDAFTEYARRLGVVSEFCLLHPLSAKDQKPLIGAEQPIDYRKEVVVVDLSKPLEQIWARIEERQRKAALAARKSGLIVRMSDLSEADFDAYHTRYLATMETVDARAFWHFPRTYFQNCRDALGHDHVSLFHAEKDGEIVASVFHIHMYDTAYYHFSCSEPGAKSLNATPLLLLDSLIWAKNAGYRWFHFGGGRTDGEDALFTFKRAFSGQTKPLFSTQRILDKKAYAALTSAAKQRETDILGQPRETSFFPRYRLQT
ncbi:GNAT family N-acetyltransferase [Roseobacter sp. A03A-229]